ncbi:Transporter [Methanosarcina barkeri str. Wiesmoor]|uniref:Transporter n=2 Tax=Methanosarcina barkeri TaxID=2208 RepID=A0A0E3LKK4_METBA|nr:SO_0444 family Cu/Zn efflux transporter [Methanosarcina barkeri]AKB49676.1 Transporter [Methanosarcina barkeri str. Wiesmoor]
MNFEFLNALLTIFSGIFLESWNIFVETAPYLIFGLGIAGLLNILVSDQKIVDYLGASAGKIRSVINAALAGLPLPLCSCGVVPAAMSIRKRGANRGATLSFLISTPETGVDSIAVTYALLDPLMAVFRPLAAFVTAILTGLADNFLIGEPQEKKNIKKQESPENKAGVLAVSTFIGAPLQEKTCSSSSCSCHKPEDFGNEKTGSVSTMTENMEVRSSGAKPLEINNKSENVRKLSLVNPGFQKEGSSCSCEECGCAENETEKDWKNKEFGKYEENQEFGKNRKSKESVKARLIKGIKYAYIELPAEISKWMLIGIFFAGIISYAVPESFIQNYLGGGFGSMLVMLLVGIPLYICATASTPLAASLVAKGMSPGTAFVFLLAGPATNVATITMVARFLGKRSAALYLGMISLCALGAGFLLDWFYLKLGVNAVATVGTAKELLPEDLKLVFAFFLLPLMLYGIFRSEKECGCSECH